MKSIAHAAVGRALAVLALASLARGAEWHVATTGADTNGGAASAPFATIQRAQQAAAPGDTVLVHGGVYRMTEAPIAGRRGNRACITLLTKSGRPGQRIVYRAAPGERPVFDCSAVRPRGLRVDAFYVSASWLHLQGLEVTGVQVTQQGHTQSICFENDGSDNIYERLSLHDGQAIGIYSVRGANNLFLNCDAWANWDYTSEGGRGGNVDGFGCHPLDGHTNNVFRGCRAWFNSDDGFDCIGARAGVTFERCWAFFNGMGTNLHRLGDGNGFKAGGYGTMSARELPVPVPHHLVRQCIAVGNPASGFYANHHPAGSVWLNNTAFRNGSNFNMLGRRPDNVTDIDGRGHVLRHNLSHGARADLSRIDRAACTLENNSFDGGSRPVDADFVSLDIRELTAPRQAGGDLPALRLLRPVKGRPLAASGQGALTP